MIRQGTEAYSQRLREIERLYFDERQTLEQVGDRFGLTRERVRQILAAAGLNGRHFGSSYTAAQLHEAGKRYARGESVESLAAFLGVCAGTLRAMAFDHGWRRPPRALPPHGTPSRYSYHGCRCSRCKREATERHMIAARQRVKEGRCFHCSANQEPGRTMCRKHLRALVSNARRRTNARRAAGLCQKCNRHTDGMLLCPRHRNEENRMRREARRNQPSATMVAA